MKELEALLSAAGFKDIEIRHRPVNKLFPTPEKAFEFNEASSFGNFLKHVPEDLRARRGTILRRSWKNCGRLTA